MPIRRISLPYGRNAYELAVTAAAKVVPAPPAPPPPPLGPLLAEALDRPIGAPRLEEMVRPGDRVLVIVSDATRDDPRAALLRAAADRLSPNVSLCIAVANGTHRPRGIDRLDLAAEVVARAHAVVDHDAHTPGDLVTLGVTGRGTPVTVHRCVAEADLIVATGCIKPHYFAGFGAGIKSIFPGLGGNREIRINHRLKREPGARAGRVDDNPCRLDLEEALSFLPRAFLLNAVADAHGGVQAAVAGDVREAFRAGARACAPMFTVRAPPSRLVVVSDRLPLTGSLYQASKLVAAVAPLVLPGGTVVVAAECPDGIGPVETVNRGIYELGIRPRLPAEHRIVLVSGLARAEVEPSYCAWAPRVESILEASGEAPVILPRAGSLIVEADRRPLPAHATQT